MEDPDPAAAIADRARRLLATREHSRLELERKLRSRGFDDAEIGEALDRLVAEGALDEARLAEQYIAERAAKGFGPVRIRAELLEKGLSDALIDPHLEIMKDDWVAYIAEVYDRRFGSESPPDHAEYARRGRFLEQRGFPPEMIRRFLRWPE
jgi:regulatory protein